MPYYWALAPDYDATFAPMITTKQGPLLQGEFRQRLIERRLFDPRRRHLSARQGLFPAQRRHAPRPATAISAAASKAPASSRSTTNGCGAGMRVAAVRPHIPAGLQSASVASTAPSTRSRIRRSEAVSQLYLAGKGNRSYFDVRTIYYLGFSEADAQEQIPVIHPVIDYNYTFDQPVLGGELGYNINFTSLTRQERRLRPDHADARSSTAAARRRPIRRSRRRPTACCAAFPGTYSRFSAETHWRRSITDSVRPGVYAVRFACAPMPRSMQIKNEPGVVQLHRHRATAISCAPCRPSASNTAIRSSACSPGARRPSSRSRR